MVVIGNPPYSGESQNKSEWIMRLMDDYKKEPNSQRPLQERNSKWLNDDYAKFIRLGQYYVDRNTEGVLAYITNRSFIDSLTFRGMRWHLMRSFDKIYIIDLHGHNNSNNIVTAPDGSKDENVFDIMQGVSINIFVKTGHKPKDGLAEVHHFDLYGKRETKYDFLLQNTLSSIPFVKLKPSAPDYFFVPKDYAAKAKYEEGFSVTELFIANSVGMVTTRDELLIKDTPDQVEHLIEDFIALDEVELRNKYGIAKDSRDWSVARAKADIGTTMDCSKIVAVSYRPFDCKYLYYTTNGLIARPRGQVMRHFLAGDNIGLVVSRQCVSDWRYVFCTKYIADLNLTGTAGRFGAGYACPLYLYPADTQTSTDRNTARTPNLDPTIVGRIAQGLGLEFEPEKSGDPQRFAPIDLFDYIYAVLHSPAYRQRYNEFLKTDFPRVPYPDSADEFRRLTALGSELRRVHLMEHHALSELVTQYPVAGDNTVTKLRWEPSPDGQTGRVWINGEQYFDQLPMTAWECYIGGYQPVQKWLKDRKGRTLAFDDILHYQRIVKALVLTEELMAAIDNR